MADPIKHNTASTVATGASGAVKGAVKGIGLFLGIGAAIGGGIALAAGGGALAVVLAALGGAATIGTLAGLTVGLPAFAVLGGGGALLGMAKSGDKIARENNRFARAMETKQHRHELAVNDAGMQGMNQGYQMGFAEGQQAIVAQLRQLQEQELMKNALAARGGHAANVMKERAAQTVASPQVG